MEFQKELECLINKRNAESNSNTPDFFLARYLIGCLANFDRIVNAREKWYGRGIEKPITPPLEHEVCKKHRLPGGDTES